MRVNEIMTRSVKVVRPETPLAEVVTAMCLYRVSGMPVVEGDERLIGMIAEKDVLARMFPTLDDLMEGMAGVDLDELMGTYKEIFSLNVSDLMSSKPITVRPDTHILKASATMASHQFRRIPVAEDDSLVGMVSLGDVHKAIFQANVHQAIGSPQVVEEVESG
ncbi:CBS domain-containing protein [Thiohalorhabdus sp.]|uniref:CBS domain-containing protein n=1 Tax=Thiohalorhabdus sp. TaxID=3094134 RepID=UPI002FC27A75